MSRCLCSTFLVLIAFVSQVHGQLAKPKAPKWSHAFDLACRKFGELDFSDKTKKWGVEAFKDLNNNLGIYISQIGDISVSNTFGGIQPPLKNADAPVWTAGLDLKARKYGETEFTDKTRTYALEVFYDKNAGNWVYIVENGHIAACPGKFVAVDSDNPKSPQWLYSFDLKCRPGGHVKFDDKAFKYGVEVYRDENNGNLIYICQTGAVAVIAAGSVKSDSGPPEWLHGQDLQCRKYGEKEFSKDTRKFGIELFRDNNAGNVLILSEVGSLAVVPAKPGLKAPSENPKDAKFSHGLDLSARQAGELEFTPATKAYSIEVFLEPNIEATLYISETGSISTAPAAANK